MTGWMVPTGGEEGLLHWGDSEAENWRGRGPHSRWRNNWRRGPEVTVSLELSHRESMCLEGGRKKTPPNMWPLVLTKFWTGQTQKQQPEGFHRVYVSRFSRETESIGARREIYLQELAAVIVADKSKIHRADWLVGIPGRPPLLQPWGRIPSSGILSFCP